MNIARSGSQANEVPGKHDPTVGSYSRSPDAGVALPVLLGISLRVIVDAEITGKSANQVARELDAGTPRVWVLHSSDGVGIPKGSIEIRAVDLKHGDEETVVHRLADVLVGKAPYDAAEL